MSFYYSQDNASFMFTCHYYRRRTLKESHERRKHNGSKLAYLSAMFSSVIHWPISGSNATCCIKNMHFLNLEFRRISKGLLIKMSLFAMKAAKFLLASRLLKTQKWISWNQWYAFCVFKTWTHGKGDLRSVSSEDFNKFTSENSNSRGNLFPIKNLTKDLLK